jgi:hypothetical protein
MSKSPKKGSNPNNIDGTTLQLYQSIVDRAHKEIEWVRSVYKWFLGILAIIVTVGIFFSYKSVQDYKKESISAYEKINKQYVDEMDKKFIELKNDYDNRIAIEFTKENVQQTLISAAKQQADEIIRNELSPAIEQAKKEIHDDKKTTIQINEISQLGARSSWRNASGGDRRSFEILLSFMQTTDHKIKEILNSEMEAIKSFYNISDLIFFIENPISICKNVRPGERACSQGFEPAIGYNADNVFNHLIDRPLWTERARAACLLRNIRDSKNTDKDKIINNKEEFYNKLISLLDGEKENSLFVSVMALNTYKELTRYPGSGIFDFAGAIEDWNNPDRKKSILSENF